MTPPNHRSSGKFVRAGKPLPTVDVDCSHWQRAAGTRSRGKFVGVAQHLPSTESDSTPPVWLELVVSFEENTPPAQVWEHTKRLIVEVSRAAPELGLIYDVNHSRTENEDVVIALAPQSSAGSSERLATLAQAIRQATKTVPPQRAVLVRVGGKAA